MGHGLDPYNEGLFGVVDTSDYRYRGIDGSTALDGRQEELQANVTEHTESLNAREYETKNEVPASAKRQLEYLGYST